MTRSALVVLLAMLATPTLVCSGHDFSDESFQQADQLHRLLCSAVGDSCRGDTDCCSGDCSSGKPGSRLCQGTDPTPPPAPTPTAGPGPGPTPGPEPTAGPAPTAGPGTDAPTAAPNTPPGPAGWTCNYDGTPGAPSTTACDGPSDQCPYNTCSAGSENTGTFCTTDSDCPPNKGKNKGTCTTALMGTCEGGTTSSPVRS